MKNKKLNILKEIKSRDYGSLIDTWIISSQPDMNIFETPCIYDLLNKNIKYCWHPKNDKGHDITGIIEGIYLAALSDITKCIYRGLATTRSVIRDVHKGQLTYPELSAYIAAFFFTKAITLILGVWISPEALSMSNNKRYFILDFFNLQKKEYHLINFNLGSQAFGHARFWSLFKTLLDQTENKTSCLCELSGLKMDYPNIPKLRNKIQYSYSFWGENDLLKDEPSEIEWCRYLYPEEKSQTINFKEITRHPNKVFLLKLLNCVLEVYGDIASQTTLNKHYSNFQKERSTIISYFSK